MTILFIRLYTALCWCASVAFGSTPRQSVLNRCAHAADRSRSHSRCRSRDRTRRRLHKFLPVVDAAPLRCVRIQTPAESCYDNRPEALKAPTKRPWGGALPDLASRSQGSEHASDRAPFHSSDSLWENLSFSASRASSACRLWHAHPQERGVER